MEQVTQGQRHRLAARRLVLAQQRRLLYGKQWHDEPLYIDRCVRKIDTGVELPQLGDITVYRGLITELPCGRRAYRPLLTKVDARLAKA